MVDRLLQRMKLNSYSVPLFYCLFSLLWLHVTQSQLCQTNCNNRGKWDSTQQSCICKSPYYGTECLYMRCPFGSNWLGKPFANDLRNESITECSNMGVCNRNTGICSCRKNFEGRACERLKCASATLALKSANVLTTITTSAVCSGHGRCLLAGEAAVIYNNMSSYNGWDSKKISGCICDVGYVIIYV